MAIAENIKLTRIIFTVGDDGNITSANSEYVRQIINSDTGEMIASSAHMGSVDGSDPALQDLLGKVAAGASAQVNQLQVQLDTAIAERDGLKAQIDSAGIPA